jgi:cytochrome d ubiquinol oxidase subunit II
VTVEAIWYALLALMLTVYVVLDGFDFGAGTAHLVVARDEPERRTVLAAIGPVWDGNEVWLITAGGTLFFAFPRAYAVAFSGFYLPLMIALWLLVVRGLSIEFRHHAHNPLWSSFCDVAFAVSSTVLAFVLGASLGNVLRGVPLGGDGEFVAPLFADFHTRAVPGTVTGTMAPGATAGVLDWYTTLVGAFAVLALCAHGAAYLAWKTDGELEARCRRMLRRLQPALMLATLLATLATWRVQPALLASFARRPWAWPLPLAVIAALAVGVWAARRQRDRTAFLASIVFLAGLLLASAAALFPILLRSTVSRDFDVTAYGAATGRRGLLVGLTWWIPALVLAVAYFAFLFRSFSGKVRSLHY